MRCSCSPWRQQYVCVSHVAWEENEAWLREDGEDGGLREGADSQGTAMQVCAARGGEDVNERVTGNERLRVGGPDGRWKRGDGGGPRVCSKVGGCGT